MVYPPCSPDLPPSDFLAYFPCEKKSSGKHFADLEEVKQKAEEALKGIKINEFKNCFKQWKKVSIAYCIKWSVLWR